MLLVADMNEEEGYATPYYDPYEGAESTPRRHQQMDPRYDQWYGQAPPWYGQSQQPPYPHTGYHQSMYHPGRQQPLPTEFRVINTPSAAPSTFIPPLPTGPPPPMAAPTPPPEPPANTAPPQTTVKKLVSQLVSEESEEGEDASFEEGEIEEYDFFNEDDVEEEVMKEEVGEEKGKELYREKLKKVLQLRKLPLTAQEESSDIGLSVVSGEKRMRAHLPAPPGYVKYFEEHFRDELKDVKGGNPLAVGSYPRMYKPKASHYEIKDAWSSEFLKEDTALCKSVLYKYKDPPKFEVKQQAIKGLETHCRGALNVACYTDSFLWSAKRMVEKMRARLSSKRFVKEPTLDIEDIRELFALTDEAMDFMSSAAKGIQDYSKMTMDEVAMLVTWRRDSYISSMSKELPEEQKILLRQQDMMGKTLFGKTALEEATVAVERTRQARTNEQVKRACSTRNEDNSSNKASRGNDGQRGSFRGKGRNERWKQDSDTPFHSFNKKSRCSRGSSNRGRGRGRAN